MPLVFAMMNAVVPLQIGARDVAFPFLNALGFWLFFFGGIFLNLSWFMGGAPDAGWTSYASLSLHSPGHGIDFYVLGLQISGLGTLISGINFLVTIVNMRTPGMTYMRMPLFTWTTFVASSLILFAFPPLTVGLVLMMFDRMFGSNFFDVAAGGNTIIWEHLFWIFGHPEVYILILAGFWNFFGNFSDFFKETIIWVFFHGICYCVNRLLRFHGVGASYVYNRPWTNCQCYFCYSHYGHCRTYGN